MNPRKMQAMMKQLGIQQVDIPATEVIIKTKTKTLVIANPSVQKVNMMGQETFQVSGEVEEQELETVSEISADDIQTVMEQAGVNEARARAALEKSGGDLAEAILDLKE